MDGAWPGHDNLNLVYQYNKFIADPSTFPVTNIKWEGRTSEEVQEHLQRIWNSDNKSLTRVFPREPSEWTVYDDDDLRKQLEVRSFLL
jgi:hypothetical protein